MSLFQTCKNPIIFNIQRRSLFHWINLQFNALDEFRLKQVGPDRVCAEWILRNGGRVKWVNADEYHEDYNKLPKDEVQVRIQEIDATGSSIMANGFEHLKNCKRISKIILDKCNHMENEALKELHYVQDTLLCLQVSRCGNVVETGLEHLAKLQKLQTLTIFGLPYVTDRDRILNILRTNMKQCKITYEK